MLPGLGFALLALSAIASCSNLSEEECTSLRTQAYDVINEAHTCDSDADCAGSAWPGCVKPINSKNGERIAAFKTKFDEGKCKEPEQECKDAPAIYCKQGLCVFRHKAGAPAVE